MPNRPVDGEILSNEKIAKLLNILEEDIPKTVRMRKDIPLGWFFVMLEDGTWKFDYGL